jgi:hypothetical protein
VNSTGAEATFDALNPTLIGVCDAAMTRNCSQTFSLKKKHFRKVNLSFSSSRFQKADDLKGRRRRRRRRRRKRTPTLTETRQENQSVVEKQVLS